MEQSELMEISITFSDLLISEKFKIYITTKHPWIWHLANTETLLIIVGMKNINHLLLIWLKITVQVEID